MSRNRPPQDWEVQQIKVFTNWCNMYIARSSGITPLMDINRDFSDGTRLIVLLDNILEEMSAQKQKDLGRASLKKYSKTPKMDIHRIQNLNLPLTLINRFCKDVGMKLEIGAEQIMGEKQHDYEGDRITILGQQPQRPHGCTRPPGRCPSLPSHRGARSRCRSLAHAGRLSACRYDLDSDLKVRGGGHQRGAKDCQRGPAALVQEEDKGLQPRQGRELPPRLPGLCTTPGVSRLPPQPVQSQPVQSQHADATPGDSWRHPSLPAAAAAAATAAH